MANLKIRGVKDTNGKGPSNGPSQPMDLGAETIRNTPYEEVKTREPKFKTHPATPGGKRL